MKKLTGFIITAGHLDIEWYQPLRSYRFWTIEAFKELKRILEAKNGFETYCLDGQYYPLKEYLDVVPEDELIVKEMIQDGLLSIGPFYTQFDEWLPSAESIIRNCLYGDRLCKKFGGYMRAGYLPDNFGHPMQMPQILKGFDIDSILFMRGMPEVADGHNDEFLYKGLDGTQIFASHFREGYGGAFDLFCKKVLPSQPREVPYYPDYLSYEYHRELAEHDDPVRIAKNMIDNVHRIKTRYPSGIIPLVAGYDHLPPQADIGISVKAANDMQAEIEFVMGNAEEYVQRAVAELDKNAPCEQYDMELIGSKYQHILLGALSSRSYLKRENFACEVLLEKYAEPLDAIASLYSYDDQKHLFDEAWEFLMVNSAHDSIHGSSVDETHVEMQSRFAGSRQISAGLIHDALKHIGRNMQPWGEKNTEILVFSPTAGENQVVGIWLPVCGDALEGQMIQKNIVIIDEKGKVLNTQVQERKPVEENGRGLPRNEQYPSAVFSHVLFQDDFQAFQIKKYRMAIMEQKQETTLIADDNYIENRWIRVEQKGGLINLLDKRSGFKAYQLNLLVEEADAGDAWDYSPPWIKGETVLSTQGTFVSRLVEAGPVCARLEVRGEISVPERLIGDERSHERVSIPLIFEITMTNDSPRVDVKLTINNTAKDHRIRLCIPSVVKTDFVRSQGHLAIIDRNVERPKEIEPWYQPPTQLLPCREWIAVQDEKHGLAIALKGMYDYEAVANGSSGMPDLYVTLLRGFELMGRVNMAQRKRSASMALHTPGAQCIGTQIMEWSYVPYEASKDDKVPFLQEVQKFLYPPVGHVIRSEHESTNVDSLTLPYRVKEQNIQFSAFKKCYDKDGYILRLYENQGKRTIAKVEISDVFTKAYLAKMNEHIAEEIPITNGEIVLEFAPYKALTIKLICS